MATVRMILHQPYVKAPGKKKKLSPYEARLYCVLIIDRSRMVKIKTQYKIYPEQWDFKAQLKKEVRGNEAGTPELNDKIRKFNEELRLLKTDFEEKYRELIKKAPDMPFTQVAEILKDYGKGKEIPFSDGDKGFFDYFDMYLSYLKAENSPRTAQKFNTLKKSLIKFIAGNKRYQYLSFSMIDHSFKDAYSKYLKEQKARGRMKTRPIDFQDGVLIDTERKYISDLKTFLRWCEERNYNKHTKYREFNAVSPAHRKRQKKDNDIVSMSLSELNQFYAHDFSDNKTLERVRDLWCFGAFTCQRWSDISKVDKSQIDGDTWTFISDKTKKETTVYLVGFSAPALEVLRKYDFRLPEISLTKFNLFVKTAAEKAGINKLTSITRYSGAREITTTHPKHKFISSHSARRTGISILLNDFGFPISHMMEITQHSDLATLKVYIDENRDSRREAMSKTKPVDKLLAVVKDKEAV